MVQPVVGEQDLGGPRGTIWVPSKQNAGFQGLQGESSCGMLPRIIQFHT